MYLEKIHIVWWTLLYFWLSSWYVLCQTLFQNPVHFYDLAACRELSGWRTDEEENHGVLQSAVAVGLELTVAFTASSLCLSGVCCPGLRLRGSGRCLCLPCGGSSCPRQLGSVCLQCPCPARGQWLLGRAACSGPWQTLSVSHRDDLAARTRPVVVEDVEEVPPGLQCDF